jgi:hypothetical protein
MIPHPHSHNPDSGSKLHFLIAAVIAVAIAIGMTSTAAQAGLIPAAEVATAATEASASDVSVDIFAREASTPGAATAPEHRYLEEEQEFAPKFQHIVPRTRAAHRLTLNTLACSLSIAQHCAPATRL